MIVAVLLQCLLVLSAHGSGFRKLPFGPFRSMMKTPKRKFTPLGAVPSPWVRNALNSWYEDTTVVAKPMAPLNTDIMQYVAPQESMFESKLNPRNVNLVCKTTAIQNFTHSLLHACEKLMQTIYRKKK